MKDSDDNRLMGEVRDGDLDRLAPLYARHRDKIYGLCVRMVRDPDEAADLVQETFLRVLRHRRSFRGSAKFTTWLYRIAHNVCLDHIRGSKRMDETASEVHRMVPQPHQDENLLILRRALDTLPPDERAVIVLARFEGLHHQELAEILDCTEGAARVRLHRAVMALRRKFDALKDLAI